MSQRSKSSVKLEHHTEQGIRYSNEQEVMLPHQRPKSAHHRRGRHSEFTSGSWEEDFSDDGIEIITEVIYAKQGIQANPLQCGDVTDNIDDLSDDHTIIYDRYKNDRKASDLSDDFADVSRTRRRFLSDSQTDVKKDVYEEDYQPHESERYCNTPRDTRNSTSRGRIRAHSMGEHPSGKGAGWDDLHANCNDARKRVLNRIARKNNTVLVELKNSHQKVEVTAHEKKNALPRKLAPLTQTSSVELDGRNVVGLTDNDSSPELSEPEVSVGIRLSQNTPVPWQTPEQINPVFSVTQKNNITKLEKLETYPVSESAASCSNGNSTDTRTNRTFQPMCKKENSVATPPAGDSPKSNMKSSYVFGTDFSSKPRPSVCRTKSNPEPVKLGITREPTMFEMMHKFKTLDT